MIFVAAVVVFIALVIVRYRRFRLSGQALRAARQPHGEWSARYPRSPQGGRL